MAANGGSWLSICLGCLGVLLIAVGAGYVIWLVVAAAFSPNVIAYADKQETLLSSLTRATGDYRDQFDVKVSSDCEDLELEISPSNLRLERSVAQLGVGEFRLSDRPQFNEIMAEMIKALEKFLEDKPNDAEIRWFIYGYADGTLVKRGTKYRDTDLGAVPLQTYRRRTYGQPDWIAIPIDGYLSNLRIAFLRAYDLRRLIEQTQLGRRLGEGKIVVREYQQKGGAYRKVKTVFKLRGYFREMVEEMNPSERRYVCFSRWYGNV